MRKDDGWNRLILRNKRRSWICCCHSWLHDMAWDWTITPLRSLRLYMTLMCSFVPRPIEAIHCLRKCLLALWTADGNRHQELCTSPPDLLPLINCDISSHVSSTRKDIERRSVPRHVYFWLALGIPTTEQDNCCNMMQRTGEWIRRQWMVRISSALHILDGRHCWYCYYWQLFDHARQAPKSCL